MKQAQDNSHRGAMRDDFPVRTKEVLAKRVGYRCSNPTCRQLTSGPHDDPARAVNVGVAAHITAASPGGPRYDPDLKPEQRQSSDNGIWLCQTHAKLVDSDDSRHTVASLKGWKSISEAMARGELEQRDFTVDRMQKFVKAEQLMPALLMEMRNDLATNPLTREFVVLKRAWVYNSGGEDVTAYFYDEHPQLDGMLQVLQNLGLIRDVTRTNVKRFRFTEELVDYLTATNPGPPRGG
jgi:hypothetical protein